jgi:hypothetical protein
MKVLRVDDIRIYCKPLQPNSNEQKRFFNIYLLKDEVYKVNTKIEEQPTNGLS